MDMGLLTEVSMKINRSYILWDIYIYFDHNNRNPHTNTESTIIYTNGYICHRAGLIDETRMKLVRIV